MSATIQPLPAGIRHYIAAFDLAAVAVTARGIKLMNDPAGASAAWWCHRDDARRVADAACSKGGDVEAAAGRLGVKLTPHDALAERASERADRLNSALADAGDAGSLSFFNTTYRTRRLVAQRDGVPFPSYPTMRARLFDAMARAAANGGRSATSSLLDEVFAQR